jgi:hypothetical protein
MARTLTLPMFAKYASKSLTSLSFLYLLDKTVFRFANVEAFLAVPEAIDYGKVILFTDIFLDCPIS